MRASFWGTMRVAITVIFAMGLGCSNSNSSQPSGTSAAVPRPGSSVTQSAFQEGIDLAESQSALDSGQLSTRFDFSRLRSLWVRMRVAGMVGTTIVHLTLTTPSGSIFYETTTAYSPNPNQTEMVVPNAPHPITIFRAVPANSGHALVYVVPVVGTALVRYPAPGRWRIDATIDGRRTLSTQIDVTYGR